MTMDMIPWADLKSVVAQHQKAGLMPSRMTYEQTMVCLATAHQLGINPYEAIRGCVVVDGKVTLMAGLLHAVVQRDLPQMQLEVLEYSRETCRVRGRRSDADLWVEISYDLEDAKEAGLLAKKNWQRHKKQMLYARASTILFRIIGASVIHGVYTPDEMGELEDPETGVHQPMAKATVVTEERDAPADPPPSDAGTTPPSGERSDGPASTPTVEASFEEHDAPADPTPREQEHLNEADALAERIRKAASSSSDPKPDTSPPPPDGDPSDGSHSTPPSDASIETGEKDPQGQKSETWTLRARRLADVLKGKGLCKTQIAGVRALREIRKANKDASDQEMLDTAEGMLGQASAGEEDQTEKPEGRRKTDGGNPRNAFWRELTKLSGVDLEHKLTELEDEAESAMVDTGDVEVMSRAQATCPPVKVDGVEFKWDDENAPDAVLRHYTLALFDSVAKARA